MAKWHGINFGDIIRGNSNVVKGVQKTGNTLRFTKGDDTTEDISLGTGGGGTSIIGRAGGRFQWSSADDGERVGLNTTYGPFFYSHTSEPSTGGRTYNASDAIDSATYTDNAYKVAIAGIPVLTTGKKVKVHYAFRVQNMNGSTVGLSLWSVDLGSTPTTSSPTHTLRGKTDDISGGSSSIQVHHGSFTTTSTISDSHVVILGEHRAGSLTTNSYMYFALTFELVD